jgi:maleamate amidohydrolase
MENYRKAGFSKNIGFGNKPALILVDFVGAYFLEHSSLYSQSIYPMMKNALDTALRIRKAAQESGILCILTKMELTPVEAEFNVMFRRYSDFF